MNRLVTFLTLGVLITSSCQNNIIVDDSHKEILPMTIPYKIDIGKELNKIESCSLSKIANSLDYIFLETTPKSLLRNIDHIALSDSFIFVNDYTKLLQFGINGKFIRQIGSYGRGPGEYLFVNDFCIDNRNGKIYILNAGNLLEYNFAGLFIRSIVVEKKSTRLVLSDTNKIMLYPFNLPGKMDDRPYSWYLIDLNGANILKIPNYLKRVHTPGLLIRESPLYSFNNAFHFMEYGIDTLYFLKNARPEPYLIINLGNMKMDPDLAITASERSNIFKRMGKKLSIRSVLESNEYVFFSLNSGFSDSLLCGIFNKKTYQSSLLKENGFLNDIDRGLIFWPKYVYKDSILIDFVDAFNFISKVGNIQASKENDLTKSDKNPFSRLLNNVKETSNPILIVCKK
jgi:hypothetical protein